MFFSAFNEEVRQVFNEDKDKFLVMSWIIFRTNYQDEYNGLRRYQCYFSYSTIEEECFIKRKKTQRIMKELEESGFITWFFKSKSRGKESILTLNKGYGLEYSLGYGSGYSLNTENTKVKDDKDMVKDTVEDMVEDTSSINISKNISNNIDNLSKDENDTVRENSSGNSNNKKKKNTKSEDFKFKSKDHEEAFKEIWSLYPNKKGIAKARERINKLLDRISKDELIRCVQRYKAECIKEKRENKYIQQGSTFFNGPYEDYLDCNYEEIISLSVDESVKRSKEVEF